VERFVVVLLLLLLVIVVVAVADAAMLQSQWRRRGRWQLLQANAKRKKTLPRHFL